MNKIDLIIDALEKAKDGWQCFDEYEKALAAARELKALAQPEPTQAAVLAEREACAKLCDHWASYGAPAAEACAESIRERGGKHD